MLVESGLVAQNREEAGEYWCACQQVAVRSSCMVTSPLVVRFLIGYGHCALCWKGCLKGVPTLEGLVERGDSSARRGGGSSARRGVSALEGGFQRGFGQGFEC